MYQLVVLFYTFLIMISTTVSLIGGDIEKKDYERIQNNGSKIGTALLLNNEIDNIAEDEDQKLVCYMNNGESSSTINWYYHIATGINKTSCVVFENVFEGLLSSEGDSNNKPYNGCAEEYYYDHDTLTWTIKLKKGLKWSDGSKLTAHDFVRFLHCRFNSNYYPNKKIKQRIKNLLLIHGPMIKNSKKILDGEMELEYLGVWAENDLCLKLQYECSNPLNETLYQFVRMYPMHKDYISQIDNDINDNDLSKLCCNGPFKLGMINGNEYITILKNDHYWDKKNVKLNEIKILINKDKLYTDLYNDWKLGNIDIININEGFASNIDDEHIKYIGLYPCTKIAAFFVNCFRQSYDLDHAWETRNCDEIVRKTINILLDRDLLITSLTLPEKQKLYGFLNETIDEIKPIIPVWADLPLLGKKHLARSILKCAGYKIYKALSIKLISYNAEKNPILKKIYDLFIPMGPNHLCELSQKIYSSSELCIQDSQEPQENLDTVDFYFFELNTLPGIAGAYTNYRMLFNDQKDHINDFMYFNKEFNKILTDIKSFNELDKFYTLEKMLIEEAPIIPINMKNQYYLIGKNIGNWIETKNSLPLEGNLYFKRIFRKKLN